MSEAGRIKRTNTMKLVELLYKKDIEELLKELYTDNGKSVMEVASILSVSPGTVHKWLKLFSIPRRHMTFI